MTFFLILLIAAAVFGLCFAVDKAFAKLFRSKAQHRSGLAIRASSVISPKPEMPISTTAA